MSKIPILIDNLRGKLLANPDIVGFGFTKQNIYRRYNPKIKAETAKYPAITISYDPNSRELWAPVDNYQIFFELRLKDYDDALAVIDLVGDTLHLYTYSGGCVDEADKSLSTQLVIYKCWLRGGPPAPMFDQTTNAWGATLEFELAMA